MQRSRPAFLLGHHISAVLDKEPYQVAWGGPMQRSWPAIVLRCNINVGAVLDEEPCHVQMTPFGRPMQRSPPALVLGCRIDAMLDEEPYNFYMSLLGSQMQRRQPVIGAPRIHILWVLDG
jgi:hypothetical protein